MNQAADAASTAGVNLSLVNPPGETRTSRLILDESVDRAMAAPKE